MSIKTWLNEPFERPVRKRWQVLLAMFLKGIGDGFQTSKINELERRVIELERKL